MRSKSRNQSLPQYVRDATSYTLVPGAHSTSRVGTLREKRWPIIEKYNNHPSGIAQARKELDVTKKLLYKLEQDGQLQFNTKLVKGIGAVDSTLEDLKGNQQHGRPERAQTQEKIEGENSLFPFLSIFQDLEQEYLSWIKTNPNGYVLNTARSISKGYMVLHRAKCGAIGQYRANMAPGAFTGQQYIKICSNNSAELSNWITHNGGTGFTKLCLKCNPSISKRITDEVSQLQAEFYAEIQKSARSTVEERLARLKVAAKLPLSVTVSATVFRRNPDVVAEVLFKSGGKCGKCGNKAPFNRASDGTPYLEVHHTIPLSEGGEDSVLKSL